MLRAGIISAVVLLTAATDAAAAAPPCPVGEARSLNSPFSEQIAAGPVLIGCVRAPHIGKRELIAYMEGTQVDRSSLCVEIMWPDGSGGSCSGGPGLTRVHGLDNSFGAGSTPDGGVEFHGFASAHVRKGTVRYWSYGKLRWQHLVITRVADKGVLGALGLTEPFAFYNVAVPQSARYMAFTARNKAGKIVHRRYLDCFLGLRCDR
jgi:hypothetical protein